MIRLDASAPELVFSDRTAWSLFAGDGARLYLARTEPARLVVRELATSGAEVRTSILDTTGWEGAIVNLRPSGGRLYAAIFGASYSLYHRGRQARRATRSADSPIFGPATTGGGTSWIGSNTRLEQLNDGRVDAAFSQLTETPLSCLETHGNTTFLCQQHRLHALEERGLGARLMGCGAAACADDNHQRVCPRPVDGSEMIWKISASLVSDPAWRPASPTDPPRTRDRLLNGTSQPRADAVLRKHVQRANCSQRSQFTF